MVVAEAVKAIETKEWTGAGLKKVQQSIAGAFTAVGGEAGQALKNFLHGKWLGHPLHAAITDVPVGAWTAALALDSAESITDDAGLGRAADLAVGVGLVGAAASAVTGLTDWSDIRKEPARLGLVHGLINAGATALYATSWWLRRSERRQSAKGLSGLGYGLMMLGAYLGGRLVYEHGIGVDRNSGKEFPEEFTAVLPDAELAEGQMKRVTQEGIAPILLARRNGRVLAVSETCSHLGGPLSEGDFEGECVRCPWHGSQFSLADGSVVDGPAVHPLPLMDVRLRHGQIEVKLVKLP